jgi:hypothetical protein
VQTLTGQNLAPNALSAALAAVRMAFGFGGTSIQGGNPWAYLQSPSPALTIDCGSTAELALVQLLQAGVSAGMSFAYPVTDTYYTGQLDATQQQAATSLTGYTLHWDLTTGASEMYEGYLFTPFSAPTTAYITTSSGPFTVMALLPSQPPPNLAATGVNGNNQLAFSVIYQALRGEYYALGNVVGGQLWYLSESGSPVGPEPFPIAY